MTSPISSDKRRQLLRDGFCLFEQILDPDLLKQTREISDALLDGQRPRTLPTGTYRRQTGKPHP